MKKLFPKTKFSTTFVFRQIPKPEQKNLESSIANPKNSIEICKNPIQNLEKLNSKYDKTHSKNSIFQDVLISTNSINKTKKN